MLTRSFYANGVLTETVEIVRSGATVTYRRVRADGVVMESRAASDVETLAVDRVDAALTSETSAELIRTRAAAALLVNRTYLALAAPVASDNVQQIRALTRQNVGLLRMLLNNLDGTD